MPDFTLLGILWFAVTAMVGAVMFAAQVGPEQAGSNLAQWARKAGVHRVPPWLRSRAADRWVLRWGKVALVLLFLVGLVGMFKLTTLSIPAMGMIACGLAFAGFFVAWLSSSQISAPPSVAHSDPIEWRFDKPVTIFMYSRRPGEGVWIDAIMIHGTNKTERALKNVKATIVPDMIDQPMQMRVNPHGIILDPAASVTLIPPRTLFDLLVAIPSKSDRPQGLPAEQFLAEYGMLRFSFDYNIDGNNTTYSHNFSLSYLEDQIAFIEEKTKAQRRLPSRQDKKSDISPGMRIVFPAEANVDSKESLFKRSWTPLPSGHPLVRRFSIHRIYVAVENPPSSKTLRKVRVHMESVNKPDRILNLQCVSDRTGGETVDIPPGGTEYFLIGEGEDESTAGMHQTRIMPKADYDALLAELDLKKNFGFILHATNGRAVPLLKNNGYILELTAYADDYPPTSARLTINTRPRIEMRLETTEHA